MIESMEDAGSPVLARRRGARRLEPTEDHTTTAARGTVTAHELAGILVVSMLAVCLALVVTVVAFAV